MSQPAASLVTSDLPLAALRRQWTLQQRLVRAEYRKLLSTTVWWWMLLSSVGLTALGVAVEFLGNTTQITLQASARDVLSSATTSVTYVPLYVLGVLSVTTEFRHRTVTSSVLAAPTRWPLLLAKAITYALVGVAYGLVCLVVELAIMLPWFRARDVTIHLSHHYDVLASVFVVLALFAVVGVGVGAMLRSQGAAVWLGVIFILVLDRVFLVVPGLKHLYPVLPDGGVSAITAAANDPHSRVVDGVPLFSQMGGALVLVVWAVAAVALGSGIRMRRDVTS